MAIPDLTTSDLTTEQSPLPGAASSAEAPANLTAALEAAEGPAAPPAPVVPDSPAAEPFMPRAEWCDLFVKAHGIAGHVIGSKVLVSVPERAGGLEAAGAVYDTCVDTPALHFLIAPGGKWFQRAALVMVFYAPIVAELRQERAQRAAPPPRPAPAPAAAPPATVSAEAAGMTLPPAGLQ